MSNFTGEEKSVIYTEDEFNLHEYFFLIFSAVFIVIMFFVIISYCVNRCLQKCEDCTSDSERYPPRNVSRMVWIETINVLFLLLYFCSRLLNMHNLFSCITNTSGLARWPSQGTRTSSPRQSPRRWDPHSYIFFNNPPPGGWGKRSAWWGGTWDFQKRFTKPNTKQPTNA